MELSEKTVEMRVEVMVNVGVTVSDDLLVSFGATDPGKVINVPDICADDSFKDETGIDVESGEAIVESSRFSDFIVGVAVANMSLELLEVVATSLLEL